ncbi:MAG: hypothetical protein ACREDR_18240 [Blastocatellia bacterium]
MNKSFSTYVLCAVFLLLIPVSSLAQDAAKDGAGKVETGKPGSEQVLRDILKEVRLLRAQLAQIAANDNRSRVLIDRIRVQQEQIAVLTRDIGDLQDKIDDVKAEEQRKQGALADIEKRKELGLAGNKEIDAAKAEIDDLARREQALSNRQYLSTVDLNTARTNLADLNKRLDKMDGDITRTPKDRSSNQAGPH